MVEPVHASTVQVTNCAGAGDTCTALIKAAISTSAGFCWQNHCSCRTKVAHIVQLLLPATATRALMGTDSGCSGRVASWWMRPTLSLGPSPSPMIPPAHTLMPASRTLCRVSSLSCSCTPSLFATCLCLQSMGLDCRAPTLLTEHQPDHQP